MVDLQEKVYDAVVIGGGQAGSIAALQLARSGCRVAVVEKESRLDPNAAVGDAANADEPETYAGEPLSAGVMSRCEALLAAGAKPDHAAASAIRDLTEVEATFIRMTSRRAGDAGAEFLQAEAVAIVDRGEVKSVHTDRGILPCFAVLLATGVRQRPAGFRGEREFRGRGVTYCVSCDSRTFAGKDVFVIGDGTEAAEESVYLAQYARHVTVLLRGDDFACDRAAAAAARAHGQITTAARTIVEEAAGDEELQYLRCRHTITGDVTEYRAEDGKTFDVFVLTGSEPVSELLQGMADFDERGFVVTDCRQQTTQDGIYAAGDVCAGSPPRSEMQVSTAVGDGTAAARAMKQYAKAMRRKTGLQAQQEFFDTKPPAAAAESAPKEAEKGRAAGKVENVREIEESSAQRAAFTENDGAGGAAARTASAAGTAGEDSAGSAASANADAGGGQPSVLTETMRQQLRELFARLESRLLLRLYLDSSPLSTELRSYMLELAALTDNIEIETAHDEVDQRPCVGVCDENGVWKGIAFHGVPGGTEFTAFVLSLYNAAGPGQPLSRRELSAIKTLPPCSIKIIVSLYCTICPELVAAAQHIAVLNDRITVEVFDSSRFPELCEKYHVSNVPCFIVNDGEIIDYGRRDIPQLIDLLMRLHSLN
ncbi:MAG: FAD-dependent oxidoreductase [Anaerovoracaceae bacterium]|jgi:thioredoxin reductase (NADPH)